MRYTYTIILLLLLAQGASAQFGRFPYRTRATDNPRKYNIAWTFSNPLSASTKYGGGVEHRWGNFSYMASSYIYKGGAYPGAMLDLDMRVYMRKRWQVGRSKWTYQEFVYWREFAGLAGFDSDKLWMAGHPKGIYREGYFYYGGSAGWGRRYSRGPFFATMKVGLRGTKFEEMPQEDKFLYKLFYATGPGSILELNFQWGVAFF